MVQVLYMAYFGRPVDPLGLQGFDAALSAANAPISMAGLQAAYSSNAAVKALVDSFGTSAESAALYGSGSTASFVNAIFENLFNRAPAASGSSFWVDELDSGAVSRGDAALAIAAGAFSNSSSQGAIDVQTFSNKEMIAGQFTLTIAASESETAAYSGSTAAAAARALLAGVGSTTPTSTPNGDSVTFGLGYGADGKMDSISLGYGANTSTGTGSGSDSGQSGFLGAGSGVSITFVDNPGTTIFTPPGSVFNNGVDTISADSAISLNLTAGDGSYVITATSATSNKITVGTGANSITLGTEPGGTITFGAHVATVVDSVTLGASGTSLTGFESISGFNNAGADTITFADAATVAAGGMRQITVGQVTAVAGSDATQLASWIAAATGAAGSGVSSTAHGINWFIFQGNTYLVETAAADTGALTANDTVVELTGTSYTFTKATAVAGTLHLLG